MLYLNSQNPVRPWRVLLTAWERGDIRDQDFVREAWRVSPACGRDAEVLARNPWAA